MATESNPGIQRLSTRVSPDGPRQLDLVPSQAARERNLQRVFVEVLAKAGIPFDIAFQIADISWEIHQKQLERKQEHLNNPPAERIEPELSDEEKEKRETRSREVWSEALKSPTFVNALETGIEDLGKGRYFDWSVIKRERDIPKLRVQE